MKEHFVFADCPDGIQDAIRERWEEERPRIERFLRRVPPDERLLRAHVTGGDAGYHVRLILHLPGATLVARGEGSGHRESLEQALARLSERVRRHLERERDRQRRWRRERRREDMAQAAELLEREVRERDRSAFREVLAGFLSPLAKHARQELLMAQLDERIVPGIHSVADLLDEVLVRAWERFDSRGRGEPLDRWLLSLLHEVLSEWEEETRTTSLEEAAASGELRYRVEEGRLQEHDPFWTAPEQMTVDELLSVADLPEGWRPSDATVEHQWILERLREFPEEARRGFTLHVVEGWEVEEVAMLLDRTPGEVEEDVARVRHALREALGREKRAEITSDEGGSPD